MEPIGAGAQDDCAQFWMLVGKCGEKGKSDAVEDPDVFRFLSLFLVEFSFLQVFLVFLCFLVYLTDTYFCKECINWFGYQKVPMTKALEIDKSVMRAKD